MASAGPRNDLKAAKNAGPSASAAEIPALAKLLDKAGWDPTPELSGVFQVGRIFMDDGFGHSLMVRECFDAEAGSDSYTSAEVVSQLQAGVRVKIGVEASASGSLEKKVKFGAPVHHTLERLAMVLTEDCAAMLSMVSDEDLARMYAVQEVLTAEITEQTCGRIDAEGKFVVGGADLELERSCSQESLEPVAVAYRSVPLRELVAPTAPQRELTSLPKRGAEEGRPQRAEEGCYWGPVQSVHSTLSTLTVNGQVMDVRGVSNRAWIVTELQRCGYMAAARSFNDWRASRRATNLSCATVAGCYPFGIGIWSAMMAKKHRLRMEQALLETVLARAR